MGYVHGAHRTSKKKVRVRMKRSTRTGTMYGYYGNTRIMWWMVGRCPYDSTLGHRTCFVFLLYYVEIVLVSMSGNSRRS